MLALLTHEDIGHAISIVMIFMYTTAQESIKRNHFNWFYLFHHLFLAFYVFLFFHGRVSVQNKKQRRNVSARPEV